MSPDVLQPDALVRAIQVALAGKQMAEAKVAFTRLFERVQPEVCQVAASWLERCYLPRHEYPDVVQHVMEELWRHLVTDQPMKSVRGWLRKAVQSTVLDQYKSARRHIRAGSLDELTARGVGFETSIVGCNIDPADAVLNHICLDQAIGELPDPEWRQVVQLLRAGYRLADISRRLPLGTERVKRCHRSALDWFQRRADQGGEGHTP